METGKLQIQIRGEHKLLDSIKSMIDAKLEEAGGVRQDAAAIAFAELMDNKPQAGNDDAIDALTLELNAVKGERDDLQARVSELEEMLSNVPAIQVKEQWYDETFACICYELIKSDEGKCKDIHCVSDAVEYIMGPYWKADTLKPDQSDIDNFRMAMGGVQ